MASPDTDIFNMADLWDTGGTTYTAIKMDVTDTASAAGSLLLDLQVGSTSKFTVDKAGDVDAGQWKATAIAAQYGGTGQDFSASTGIVKFTSGTASVITDNSSNWDTAFGWGNHASAGYITSISIASGSSGYASLVGGTELTFDAIDLTADVTGTLADASVAESNVTQHQAALSITESQISDLGSYITSISIASGSQGYASLVGGTELTFDAIAVGEIDATGTPSSSTFLRGDGSWATPAGSGDVSKVGTPVDSQIGVWTGDGTIEGDTALTFDTSTDTLAIAASGKLAFGAVNILSDSAGTMTLSNIDALDPTTEATIEAAIDTLANLTSATSLSITESQISDLGAYITDVVSDTTPQLGGSLDVNGQKIVSTANGNIDIEPNGTGNVLLGNFTFDADQTVGAGQDNYVLTYDNGSGLISLEASAGGGLSNVVDDTTPQLGGMLDVNGNALGDGTLELLKFSETVSAVNEFTIANAATTGAPVLSATGDDTNIGITLTPKGTGNITLGTMVFDSDQTIGAGQDNYVLTYDNASGLISLEVATGGGDAWGDAVDANITFDADGTRNIGTLSAAAGTIYADNISGTTGTQWNIQYGGSTVLQIGNGQCKFFTSASLFFDNSLNNGSSSNAWAQTWGYSIYLKEQAAAKSDTAGAGQFWVENLTPNVPKFTDDAGTDFDIATSSGTTGGTGSAGAGNQYIEISVGGTTYKVLHDGTV